MALAQDSSAPTPSTSSPAATGGKHVEGTCDEAERANDPNASARPRGRRHHENDDQGENEDNTTGARTRTTRPGRERGLHDQGENDDNQA